MALTGFAARLGAAWLLCAAAAAAFGAEQVALDLDRAAQLVIALDTKVGERALQGAGVVVARERDAVVVVTADHLVRQGTAGASELVARFKAAPQKRLAARLLASFDRVSDIALLRIDNLRAQGVDPCRLPAPRFEETLAVQRGHGVFAVGNPGGVAWRVPVAPDEVTDVGERDIRFQSTVIESGHSGGALFNAFGDLVGIVRADQPPYGLAVRLDHVMRLLRGWGVAVRGGAAPDPCTGAADAAGSVAAGSRASPLPAAPERWGLGTFGNNDMEWMPLFQAVQRGDVAGVKRLATGKALDPDGYHLPIPLHWAAAFGQVEVAKQLLLMGAKKNAWVQSDTPGDPYRSGMGTPLHLAARANQVEVIKVLIRAGAALEQGAGMSDGPGTPLVVAARNGQIEAARVLIEGGADVNAGRRYTEGWKATPLAAAVAGGHIEMIKLLEASKARLSDNDDGGPPALLRVAINGNQLDALRYLIARRVPMECGSLIGRCDTPLYVAVNDGKLDAMRILLAAGADPNRSSYTPYLHMAVESGRLDVLKLLLKAGADPNVRDREGKTPLAQALERENADAVALLRASGASGAKR